MTSTPTLAVVGTGKRVGKTAVSAHVARLLAAAGIEEYDRVEVYDITRGSRFATYAIEAPSGSGTVSVNGAAARLVSEGDLVIVAAYGTVEVGEPRPAPRLVFVDERNRVAETKEREIQGVLA